MLHQERETSIITVKQRTTYDGGESSFKWLHETETVSGLNVVPPAPTPKVGKSKLQPDQRNWL
jgi:hypothetical protein